MSYLIDEAFLTDSAVDLSVVAPCFNESPNIRPFAERVGAALADHHGGFELVLVDDASKDDTWERMQEVAAKYPFVRLARHEKNRGIVEGWRTGLMTARADRIVTIDADLQYRPEDVPRLVEAMDRHGADFVQGWRERQVRRGFLRTTLTAGLSWALNLFFGMKLKDNKSGFVLYKRKAMEEILSFHHAFRYYQHFIAIAANSLGLKIVQVPIVFDERHAGQSFITHPLRFSLQALPDIPRAIWEFRIRKIVRGKGRP
jgi:glycosyltransferase involved in cell wall biosynthesis